MGAISAIDGGIASLSNIDLPRFPAVCLHMSRCGCGSDGPSPIEDDDDILRLNQTVLHTIKQSKQKKTQR